MISTELRQLFDARSDITIKDQPSQHEALLRLAYALSTEAELAFTKAENLIASMPQGDGAGPAAPRQREEYDEARSMAEAVLNNIVQDWASRTGVN